MINNINKLLKQTDFPRYSSEKWKHPSLLCVFAHPDDEVSFSGMAMECLQASGDVTFVCATNGQARIPDKQHNNFRKEQMQNAALLAVHHVTRNAFFKTLNSDRSRKLHYWCRMEEEFLKKFRKEVPHAVLEKHHWELTEAEPTKKLDVRKHLSKKLEALFCHEGQRLIHYLRGLDRNKQEAFLGYEYFHLAHPNGNFPTRQSV